MAGNSEWNKAVKQAFKMGRKTRKSYSLKDAMFDAKKIYKKGKNAVLMEKQTRRRSSAKKGYNRRRMYRGGEGLPESSGSSMLGNLSKMAGLNAVSDSTVAKITESPSATK